MDTLSELPPPSVSISSSKGLGMSRSGRSSKSARRVGGAASKSERRLLMEAKAGKAGIGAAIAEVCVYFTAAAAAVRSVRGLRDPELVVKRSTRSKSGVATAEANEVRTCLLVSRALLGLEKRHACCWCGQRPSHLLAIFACVIFQSKVMEDCATGIISRSCRRNVNVVT